jgi:hypothetical protein
LTLPTFLMIGAMKAGTTSLWEYLRTHPDVYMPDTKELDYFVAEKAWARGIEWYGRHFDGAGDARAVGEASTNYTKYPQFDGVPARVASVLPDVRLVYVVRHPLDRMRSQWQHAVAAGWERLPLGDALLTVPEYVDNSRYAMQLDRWLEHFSRERVLVVTAEDLRDERSNTVDRVLCHLGVAPGLVEGLDREMHTGAEKEPPRRRLAWADRLPGRMLARRVAPPAVRDVYARMTRHDHPTRATLTPAAERELVDRVRPDVARLRELLAPGFDGWGIA